MTSIIGIFQDFIEDIKTHYNIDITFNIVVTIIETVELIKNPDQCIALVTNMNNSKRDEPYQCTRTKKFGMFCGLHYNRKNEFLPIQKYIETHKYNYYITK